MRNTASAVIKRTYPRPYLDDSFLVCVKTDENGQPSSLGKLLHSILSKTKLANDPSDKSESKSLVSNTGDLAGSFIKDLWGQNPEKKFCIQSQEESSILVGYNYIFTYKIERSSDNKPIETLDSIKVVNNADKVLFLAKDSDIDTLWKEFEEYCTPF